MRYLVRHAHAGSQKRWRGLDQLRPLSALGDRQAVGLLARLGGYPVTRILSSPTVRCHQTVVPLSQERPVPIEVVAALDVDAPVEGLLKLMADPSMETTILCGHGGQIVGALRLLCGGAASGGQLSRQKGSTWVVDQDGGDLRAVRYLPPLQLKRWPAGPNPATRSEPGFPSLVNPGRGRAVGGGPARYGHRRARPHR
jgi:phosphohistidine phosphatase SixA